MTGLSIEQKEYMIQMAIKSYEIALAERQQQVDAYYKALSGLSESCANISSLIHFIAKRKYNVPDEGNEVYYCLFTFGESPHRRQYSHYVNRIFGEFIDASIEQFNLRDFTFSPYECNEKYYASLEKVAPVFDEAGIKEEIAAFETLDFSSVYIARDKKAPPKKEGWFHKLWHKD